MINTKKYTLKNILSKSPFEIIKIRSKRTLSQALKSILFFYLNAKENKEKRRKKTY